MEKKKNETQQWYRCSQPLAHKSAARGCLGRGSSHPRTEPPGLHHAPAVALGEHSAAWAPSSSFLPTLAWPCGSVMPEGLPERSGGRGDREMHRDRKKRRQRQGKFKTGNKGTEVRKRGTESSRDRERQTERQREGQKNRSPLNPPASPGPPFPQTPPPNLGHGGITYFAPALGAGDTPPETPPTWWLCVSPLCR